ncbi:MAG: hypothetical protein HY616_07410, partial [Candidatus Rokubacteria bacterium]|nr:hypothetical protein [Candidatus Rokubacteria bacterium]
MTAAIGSFALFFAFVLALAGSALPVVLGRRDRAPLLFLSGIAIAGQFALVTVAAASLVYALVTADF